MPDLPIIELRRIEANIIRPIYEEMAAELGEEKARRILGAAIRRNAIEQGRTLADAAEEPAGIAGFAKLLERWTANDALRIEVLEQDDERFDFNVVRCRYSEMYRDMGLGRPRRRPLLQPRRRVLRGLRSAPWSSPARRPS